MNCLNCNMYMNVCPYRLVLLCAVIVVVAIPQHVAPTTGPDLVAVNCTTPDASVTVRVDSFRQKMVANGTAVARWRGEIDMSYMNGMYICTSRNIMLEMPIRSEKRMFHDRLT